MLNDAVLADPKVSDSPSSFVVEAPLTATVGKVAIGKLELGKVVLYEPVVLTDLKAAGWS